MGGLCETCTITPDAVCSAGSGAAVPWQVTARGKNARQATAQGVDVITVNGQGKIQEVHAYWDADSFVGALN